MKNNLKKYYKSIILGLFVFAFSISASAEFREYQVKKEVEGLSVYRKAIVEQGLMSFWDDVNDGKINTADDFDKWVDTISVDIENLTIRED